MEGHIYIYGEIIAFQGKDANEFGCVNIKDIQNQIAAQPEAETFRVHINSVGGDVNEGFGIHDILKASGKKIITQIEGLCASISTIIALAGEERLITENSEIVIHNPFGFAGGEAEDVQKFADQLQSVESKLANFYADNPELIIEQASDFMKDETRFNANKSKEFGFVTEIVTSLKAVAKLNINKNTNMENKITEEQIDKKFDSFFDKVKALFIGSKIKNLMLKDANDQEIDFGDIETESEIAVGLKGVKIDGSPATGVITMPDGKEITFEAGEITEIKEPEGEGEDIEALKTENESLKSEIETLKSAQAKVETEFEAFKTEIKSSFKFDKDGNPDPERTVKNRHIYKTKK